MAETEETRYRANLEYMARRVAMDDIDEAEHALREMQSTLTKVLLKQNAESLHQQLASVRTERNEKLQRMESHAGSAYLRVMERRLKQAQSQGDAEKVKRYESIVARSRVDVTP